MRIPVYEKLGNEPQVVSDDHFFGELAELYVEAFTGVHVWSQDTIELNDDYPFTVDPLSVVREAAGAIAEKAAVSAVQYRVHVALHRLWAQSYEKPEGEEVRATLQRNFLNYQAQKQTIESERP